MTRTRALWPAGPKRRRSADGQAGSETKGRLASPPMEPESTCTQVQVLHSSYRENEAKTGAKVESQVICLFCFICSIFGLRL